METEKETRDCNSSRRSAAVPSEHHRRRMNSPLRSHSSMLSEDYDPPFTTPETSPANFPCTAIVAVDKCSVSRPPIPPLPPPMAAEGEAKPPLVVVNRSVAEEMGVDTNAVAAAKVVAADGGRRWSGGGGREERSVSTILRRSKRGDMLKRVALVFRVCEIVLSLIAFSVMAADKTKGWSGDSFDRYREYRYCLGVNVIAFVYSGLESYATAHHLVTGKHLFSHHLIPHFHFLMDQVLSYLLISASSAAATRVEDWRSNWGRDPFTEMATASVAVSFSAFFFFALSSVVSAYYLFTHNLS